MQDKSLTSKNKFDFLVHKVSSVRNKETLLLLFDGIMLTLIITLFALFAVVLIESLAKGDTSFRLFLIIFLCVIFLVTLGITSLKNILRFFNIKYLPTLNDIALRIGKIHPELKDKLGNILQLFESTDHITPGISQDLIQAELDNIYSDSHNKNFTSIINKKRTRNIFLLLIITIFLVGVSIGSSHYLGEAFYRLKNFNKSFLPPAPFSLELITPNKTVLRGENVNILFKSTGAPPSEIILHIKEEHQQKYDEIKIKLSPDKSYHYEIQSLKENISFYGEAKWLTSSILTKIGSIKVSDRPILRSLSGNLNYPSYTKLSSKPFDEQSADLSSLYGSVANFNITANKNLKQAYIVFEKSELIIDNTDSISNKKIDTFHVPLRVSGKQASGALKITQNGSYYFVLVDSAGLENLDPIKYSMVSLSDAPPNISLIFPTSDVQVTEQAVLPMKIAISDDYGFSQLKLYYKLVASKYSYPDNNYTSIKIPVSSSTGELALEIPYVWDLNKISIVPEDIYEFYLEIADNDVITGPKTARTQTLKLRLPSLEEVAKEADISHNKIVEELDKLKKETEQIKKNMDELERDLRKKQNQEELDWKQQKQLKDILQRQNEVKKKMDNLSESLQETAQQLQENKMLSQETMQKYQELQKLMQEVRSPQLERLQKMREEALKHLTPDEIKKALEEAKFDEEQFKKSIERTMNILKRIQAEQKTDAITKRAEELKKKEDELNKNLNNTDITNQDNLNELSKTQEQIKKETDNLSKDLKDLANLMEEIGKDEMPMDAIKEAQDALDKQNLQHDMQLSSEQMKSGEKSKADKSQKSASKKLDNFAKKMQKLKQEMQKENSKEVVRKMQKAVDNMLNISERQKKVKNKTQQADYNSTRVPEYAQEQADLFEDLYNVANDLSDIGNKSFAVTQDMAEEILNSLSKMRRAMDMMTDRRMINAANAQQESMQSINNALSQMQAALSQMQQQGDGSCSNPGGMGQGSGNSGGGFGMGQRMQQMAAEQQALTQMMQDMMGGSKGGSGQDGGMSQEQRSEMKRLADKQGEMQKTLEQLAKEQREFGNIRGEKSGKKIENELNNIAKEMREVAKDVQRGNITPETIQRQEKILSRLLDATKSVNERDFEKKRESISGKDIKRSSPIEIDLSTQEGKSRVMQEFLQSIKHGYTKDYEQVIRKYFEHLTAE